MEKAFSVLQGLPESPAKVLVAPTAFKGTLSAPLAAERLAVVLAEQGYVSRPLPLTDGGDDTLACLMAAQPGWFYAYFDVTGPVFGMQVRAAVLISETRETAVIEAAQAHGLARLPLSPDGLPQLAPMTATAYGVGELISNVVREYPDLKTLTITLGGSASTDGGLGALAALGWQFLRGDNVIDSSALTPEVFLEITDIQPPAVYWAGPAVHLVSDVVNPLLGPQGTARVFAPQKGADDYKQSLLEQGLAHFADLLEASAERGRKHHTGSGAAGGLAFGLMCALPEVTLGSGFEWYAEAVGLETALQGADWVISGEGRLDTQSFSGKTLGALIQRMSLLPNPQLLLLCGQVRLSESEWPGGKKPNWVHVFGLDQFEAQPGEAMHRPVDVLCRMLKRS